MGTAGGVYTNPHVPCDFGALGKRFLANLKGTSDYRVGQLLAFLNAAAKHLSRLNSTTLALTSAMTVWYQSNAIGLLRTATETYSYYQ